MTVNGEAAEIIKSNIGFMSVIVPKGEDVHIAFTYTTPGLAIGIVVSLVSLFLLVGFLILIRRSERNQSKKVKTKKALVCGKFSDYAKSHNTSFKRKIDKYYLVQKKFLPGKAERKE